MWKLYSRKYLCNELVGSHVGAINRLNDSNWENLLRQRMGHTSLEITAGVVAGILIAWIVDQFYSFIA